MLVFEGIDEEFLVLGKLGPQVWPTFSVEHDEGFQGFLEGLEIEVSGLDIKSVLLSLNFFSHLVQFALLFGLFSFLALSDSSILNLFVPVEMVASTVNIALG